MVVSLLFIREAMVEEMLECDEDAAAGDACSYDHNSNNEMKK